MRFSLWPNAGIPWDELVDLCRHAERTGWDGIWFADHFMPNAADVSGPTAEAWTTIAGLAAAVPRVRIGTLVLGNTYRHPAVVANMAATVDRISGGRLVLGVGAGWQVNEHEQYGITLPPVRERLDRFEEAVQVLRGLLTRDRFSFAGEHYTITDYTGQPVPVQRPHPPFFIGGGGRRTLTLAGREADIVGLAPRIKANARVDAPSLTLAATREKIGWVREAAGDRFGSLEFNIYPSAWPVTVTDDLRGEARRVVDHLRSRTGVELTEDDVIDSPHLFIGSVDRLVEKFLQLREELGISSIMLGEFGELEPVLERLSGS